MPDNQKSKLWKFLTTHFGGDSTGVRNWLAVGTLSNIGVISAFLGVFGIIIGSPLYFGLLIGFGIFMVAGITGSLIAGIFSLYNDYQDYKIKPQPKQNYFLDLLNRLWTWVCTYPFYTIFFIITLGLFLTGIGALVILGPVAMATPLILFISQTLGGLNVTFIIAAVYSATAFLLIGLLDMCSRSIDLQEKGERERVSTVHDWSKWHQDSDLSTRDYDDSNTSLMRLQSSSPLLKVINNELTLASGEIVKYHDLYKSLISISEDSNNEGKFAESSSPSKPLSQINFECAASSYFVIAFNPTNQEYFFLNISKSQIVNNKDICKNFFQPPQINSTDKLELWCFKNADVTMSLSLGIPEKNISSCKVTEAKNLESASFNLSTGMLKINYDFEEVMNYSLKNEGQSPAINNLSS